MSVSASTAHSLTASPDNIGVHEGAASNTNAMPTSSNSKELEEQQMRVPASLSVPAGPGTLLELRGRAISHPVPEFGSSGDPVRSISIGNDSPATHPAVRSGNASFGAFFQSGSADGSGSDQPKRSLITYYSRNV